MILYKASMKCVAFRQQIGSSQIYLAFWKKLSDVKKVKSCINEETNGLTETSRPYDLALMFLPHAVICGILAQYGPILHQTQTPGSPKSDPKWMVLWNFQKNKENKSVY